ncbi:MAG: hypothetical protein QNJ00_00110 [Woeseiaceae bacterium]|nr:hypothetical protein [Woeseiaceae bacterium]
MNRTGWVLFVSIALLFGAVHDAFAGPPGGKGLAGRECTRYEQVEVPRQYCAHEAPKTCYIDERGARCVFGGYCVGYATRMIAVKQCADFVCKEGYVFAELGCYTQAQLKAREQWRVQRAVKIAARENGLSRRDPEAMTAASFAFSIGLFGLPKDYQLAFDFAKQACDAGSGNGCGAMAHYFDSLADEIVMVAPDEQASVDAGRALALRERGCELGGERACYALALSYMPKVDNADGAARQEAIRGAQEAFGKACDLGHGTGCEQLASLYLRGLVASQAPYADALRLYDGVCLNARDSDFTVASNCKSAAVLYYNGAGDVEVNRDTALERVRRARKVDERHFGADLVLTCIEAGGPACGVSDSEWFDTVDPDLDMYAASVDELIEASKFLDFKPGATPDEKRLSEEYNSRACELGSDVGCRRKAENLWYGRIRYSDLADDDVEGRQAEGLALFEDACAMGNRYACRSAAAIHLFANPVQKVVLTTIDPGEPKPLVEEADLARGAEYYARSCELGHPSSCESMGHLHRAGYSAELTSERSALAYFLKGCDLEESLSVTSCIYAASMLNDGSENIEQDTDSAKQLVLRAKRLESDPRIFTADSALWISRTGICILDGNTGC